MVTGVRELFERVLPERARQHPDWLERLHGPVFRIHLEGSEGGTWIVAVESSQAIVRQGDGPGDYDIRLPAADLLAVCTGVMPIGTFVRSIRSGRGHVTLRGRQVSEGELVPALRLFSLLCEEGV